MGSNSTPPPLHELESEVMNEVWSRGRATVRDVLEELNRGPKQRAYTTVMTIMTRLARKGLLTRVRDGKADIYSPVVSRGEYADARAAAEVEALVEEFGDVALVHFARRVCALDRDRLEELRALAAGED
jgi:predicted transcriptional regulator